MGNSKGKVVEGKKSSGEKIVKLSTLRPRKNTVKLKYNGTVSYTHLRAHET